MRRIVDIANVAVTVVTGAYLVLLTVLATDRLRLMPDALAESWSFSRFLVLLIGAALVAANVKVLMQEWREGGLRKNLRITTEQGVIEFSAPSLEMLILRDLKAEPDVVDPVVALKPRGEGRPMLCKVELNLRRQKETPKRIDALKRQVRDIIEQLIPGGLTVEVVVKVNNVVSESMRRETRTSSREILPRPGEFNGPVYSDGGGSEGV